MQSGKKGINTKSESAVTSANIINRLFSSFTELEGAIRSARKTLAERDSTPENVIERLDSYEQILVKQRSMAVSLCEHINRGDWDEVSRKVSIINGLSGMIRDDARAILGSLQLNSDHAPVEHTNYC